MGCGSSSTKGVPTAKDDVEEKSRSVEHTKGAATKKSSAANIVKQAAVGEPASVPALSSPVQSLNDKPNRTSPNSVVLGDASQASGLMRADAVDDPDAPLTDASAAKGLMSVVQALAVKAIHKTAAQAAGLDVQEASSAPSARHIVMAHRMLSNTAGTHPGSREILLEGMLGGDAAATDRGALAAAIAALREMTRPEASAAKAARAVAAAALKGGMRGKGGGPDVMVVAAESGQGVVDALVPIMRRMGHEVQVVNTAGFNVDAVEEACANTSIGIVVVLTHSCLLSPSLLFALRCIKHYGLNYLMVHSVESCSFPAFADQPEGLHTLFTRKAHTFISQYAEYDAEQVLDLLEQGRRQASAAAEKARATCAVLTGQEAASAKKTLVGRAPPHVRAFNLAFRGFLSYQRHMTHREARRLFSALSDDYAMFWDSDGRFAMRDRMELVSLSAAVILFLSEGYLEDLECYKEFKAALLLAKPMIIVADYHYRLPKSMPAHVSDREDELLGHLFAHRVVYHPAHFEPCVELLRGRLGLSDAILAALPATAAAADSSPPPKEGEKPPAPKPGGKPRPAAFGSLPALRKLELGASDGLSDKDRLSVLRAIRGHTGLTDLRILGAHAEDDLADAMLAVLGSPGCALKSVEMGLPADSELKEPAARKLMLAFSIAPELRHIAVHTSGTRDAVLAVALGTAVVPAAESIDLSGCAQLGPAATARLFAGFQKYKQSVTALDLSGCPRIGMTGVAALCDIVQQGHLPTLARLRLANLRDAVPEASGHSLDAFCDRAADAARLLLASSPPALTELDISNMPWSPRQFAPALSGLAANTTLKKLSVGHDDTARLCHHVGSGGVASLVAALQSNATLEELNIPGACITSDAVATLCEAVMNHPSLRHLDLSARKGQGATSPTHACGGHAATALAAMIASPGSKLRLLRLAHCAIDDDGGVEIGAALRGNDTLEELDVSYTPMSTGRGLESLADAIAHGATALKTFRAACCGVHGRSIPAAAFRAALAGTSSLEVLDLSAPDDGDLGPGQHGLRPTAGQVEDLIRGLRANTSLTTLVLDRFFSHESTAPEDAPLDPGLPVISGGASPTPEGLASPSGGSRALADFLADPPEDCGLTSLRLRGALTCPADGAALASALAQGSSGLTALDVSRSPALVGCMEELSHALAASTSLQELCAEQCGLDKAAAELLANGLSRRTTPLPRLMLGENPWPPSAKLAVKRVATGTELST